MNQNIIEKDCETIINSRSFRYKMEIIRNRFDDEMYDYTLGDFYKDVRIIIYSVFSSKIELKVFMEKVYYGPEGFGPHKLNDRFTHYIIDMNEELSFIEFFLRI